MQNEALCTIDDLHPDVVFKNDILKPKTRIALLFMYGLNSFLHAVQLNSMLPISSILDVNYQSVMALFIKLQLIRNVVTIHFLDYGGIQI